GSAPAAPAAAPQAEPAARASVAAVRGAALTPALMPVRPSSEEDRSAANEALYGSFEAEKKRMGIAAIVAKDEVSERARRVLSAAKRLDQPAPIESTRPALLGKVKALPGGPPPLRSQVAYQAAWSSLLLPGDAPPVDFRVEMVVLLPEPGEVLSALESAGEFVVTWSPFPGTPRERLRPVPASMLPVRLQKLVPAPAP
ncbi:MAG: hypothetical protein SF051_03315, partial [Elusimicrobiota bacterium]|nr:hypothetical protein [Elusimicrobiota bacterium]